MANAHCCTYSTCKLMEYIYGHITALFTLTFNRSDNNLSLLYIFYIELCRRYQKKQKEFIRFHSFIFHFSCTSNNQNSLLLKSDLLTFVLLSSLVFKKLRNLVDYNSNCKNTSCNSSTIRDIL